MSMLCTHLEKHNKHIYTNIEYYLFISVTKITICKDDGVYLYCRSAS